jgi:hypothetical protein
MSNNSAGIGAYGQSGSIVNFANGGYTGDGSGSIAVAVGFTPRWVKVYDITDATTYEWSADMPATNSMKQVTAGNLTVDTNSAIVTNGAQVTVTEVAYPAPGSQTPTDGTQGTVSITYDNPNLANPQLTFGSVCNVSAKVYAWVAMG